MLFESVIVDVLKFLPSQKLLAEKKRVRELLAQKRRLLTKEDVVEAIRLSVKPKFVELNLRALEVSKI